MKENIANSFISDLNEINSISRDEKKPLKNYLSMEGDNARQIAVTLQSDIELLMSQYQNIGQICDFKYIIHTDSLTTPLTISDSKAQSNTVTIRNLSLVEMLKVKLPIISAYIVSGENEVFNKYMKEYQSLSECQITSGWKGKFSGASMYCKFKDGSEYYFEIAAQQINYEAQSKIIITHGNLALKEVKDAYAEKINIFSNVTINHSNKTLENLWDEINISAQISTPDMKEEKQNYRS